MQIPNKNHFIVDKHAKDINLRDFFDVIRKRFWIIALITILSTAFGYFISTHNHTSVYETSTRIIIVSDSNYMNTLMVMIKDPLIMQKVQEELDIPKSPEAIASQIEITRIDESQVIKISVVDSDPKMAMNIANATARSFKSEIGNILDFDEVQLLSEAKESGVPINENQNRIVIITFIIELISSIGCIFLLDYLYEIVRKEEEVEELLGVPVLGVISNMKKLRNSSKNRVSQKEMKLRGDKVSVSK